MSSIIPPEYDHQLTSLLRTRVRTEPAAMLLLAVTLLPEVTLLLAVTLLLGPVVLP